MMSEEAVDILQASPPPLFLKSHKQSAVTEDGVKMNTVFAQEQFTQVCHNNGLVN